MEPGPWLKVSPNRLVKPGIEPLFYKVSGLSTTLRLLLTSKAQQTNYLPASSLKKLISWEKQTIRSHQIFTKYRALKFGYISTNIAFHFSLFTSFTFVLGAQKNRPIETVALSTHNICFGWEIRKLIFIYALLSSDLFNYFWNTFSRKLY